MKVLRAKRVLGRAPTLWLPIEHLTLSSPKPDDWPPLADLQADIAAKGMEFPIIVSKWLPRQWANFVAQKAKRAAIAAPLIGEHHLVVYAGNQRIHCALKLGYDTIEAVVGLDPEHCERLARQMHELDPQMDRFRHTKRHPHGEQR